MEIKVSETKVIADQLSWVIRNDQVELAVTQLGAQMAPVTFYRGDATPVSPYYISPWQGEKLPLSDCPVLVPLRGDFFCLPFGGNGMPYQGEAHPPHGETAGAPWTFGSVESEGPVTSLTLCIKPKVRSGKVTRRLSIVEGENVVYERTLIEGFAGGTSLSHHAILAMPETEGSVHIANSSYAFGMTCPYFTSNPAEGEYQALLPNAVFERLDAVPSIFKGAPDVDCTAFPARRGFADILQVFSVPSPGLAPAWVAAVNTEKHFLWFALKDAAVLPGRVFWMENRGRHGSPWNGRNCCLGIEDGCSFFEKGIAESVAPNVVNERGIPTCHQLDGKKPFAVNYIQGVVKIPADFIKVKEVEFSASAVVFISETGQRVAAPVRVDFLRHGRL